MSRMALETFTKLESRIIGSTIWTEDDHTRLLWITMLALADRDGYVGASVPGLASLARIPLESAERAIEKFLSPDRYSRSQEHEGRRIMVSERGWTLLNYARIRGLRDTEERREYEAERKRRYRAKQEDSPAMSLDVRDSPAMSAQAETETDAEREEKKEARPRRKRPDPPLSVMLLQRRKRRSTCSEESWLTIRSLKNQTSPRGPPNSTAFSGSTGARWTTCAASSISR